MNELYMYVIIIICDLRFRNQTFRSQYPIANKSYTSDFVVVFRQVISLSTHNIFIE